MTEKDDIVVATGDEELGALAAELLARAIDEAVRTRGRARVALSGGTTPGPALRALAALDLPWDRVEWFQVDERAAAPDSPRSNWRGMLEALGGAARAAAATHRMEAERADRVAAAADYERAMRASFGVARAVAFDAIVLGIGDDGHTASLFPGTQAVAIEDRLAAAVDAPDGLEPRLTLTAPVIREAALVLVLARGASKAAPMRDARMPGPLDQVPARIVGQVRGRATWIVDRAAAG